MSISAPRNLRCEYLKNPLGIDTRKPRFSWEVQSDVRGRKPAAFQILVATSKENLSAGKSDVWDSGKVVSDRLVNIGFGGKTLCSRTRYFWNVRWWNAEDEVSPFSEIAFFETGLLNERDWQARWITMPDYDTSGKSTAPDVTSDAMYLAGYFRKEFSVQKNIRRARAYICGLGYCEFRLNGKKVGDHVLDPGWTDYQQLALYSTYDITSAILEENAAGVILGNGRHLEEHGYGVPKLILQLHIEFDDGTEKIIVSDDTWASAYGPLRENGIFYGERYDARLEMSGWDLPRFDDSLWKPPIFADCVALAAQMNEPVRVVETLKVKAITRPTPGTYIFDFGQNFSGWARLAVRGARGTQVKLRFAELIHPDGTLNPATNKKAKATDVYILKGGEPEIYQPRFTYHGFRYVEVTGFPGVPTAENIEGKFIHSDVEPAGEFLCSDDLINRIHRNVCWGQLSNLMSIPTDCPQREERQGWLGDAMLTTEEAIFNFRMAPFYTKFLRDIRLSQKPDGSLPDVVPPYWHRLYPADPAWGTGYITIAWYVYWYYNDADILAEHYEAMKKYVEFLRANANDHLQITLGKYGDWCPPGAVGPKKIPVEFTATWYYYHDVMTLAKIADCLDQAEDAQNFSQLAESIKQAFNQHFLKGGVYRGAEVGPHDKLPNQTSNALPLYLNMVPDDQRQSVLSRLHESVVRINDYHVDTGIHGTRYLLDVLCENGFEETAYKVVTQQSYPGWGYILSEGATTLWESWQKLTGGGINSHNHIMQGSVDAWFYKYIAGLSCPEPGWKVLQVKPSLVDFFNFAAARLKTGAGDVSVSWEKPDAGFELHIDVPVGSRAKIYLPSLTDKPVIYESGTLIWQGGKPATKSAPGVTFLEAKNKFIAFTTGSGSYHFSVTK
ncbi:family 78 glycoside hydrolase catalytic domain [candidate division KSB1 bacterium]|nr:family 78 glycoside hydrolase catalytic domain [candidate division KSB1 bacterium]